MVKKFLQILSFAPIAMMAWMSGAHADIARPWQLGFQEPQSPVMKDVVWFHDVLLVIITLITLFVLGLLLYIAVKFNEKSNPVPSKTTHNSTLEVLWTAIPILILVGIAVPSFKLLYFQDRTTKYEMTLKVTGHQWYWSYEYPDHGNIKFNSNMVQTADLKKGQPRLLTVDNPVYLPINTNIRLLLTASDVIHSWALPALIQKTDNVPGRINESWVHINKPGTYYGQCSELCGVNHGFMPVMVKAVTKEEFAAWVAKAKKKFASDDDQTTQKLAQTSAR
ncbi:MAG: cytochrome c oxidase subunit II [Rhodospirillales bacterium]